MVVGYIVWMGVMLYVWRLACIDGGYVVWLVV